ncbi:MAG TPA: glycosyltransferase [Quisquiliibacterium sp.]|nr:glycosyltransferase [Quisquiliibacterium sp.]
MRIVHVVESLDMGGAEQMLVTLARMQRAHGHDVSVVCLFNEGVLAEEARAAGVPVDACGKRPGLDLRAVRRMRRFIAGARPDVLHSHNPVPHYYAIAATRGVRIGRVLNTRHGMGSSGATGRRDFLFRLAMRATDWGVAVCEAARQRFLTQGLMSAERAVTVRNGIDLTRIRPRSDDAHARLLAGLAVQGSPFVFGSVGRLNVLKDQVTMLRAFAAFCADAAADAASASASAADAAMRAAILVIAGEGEMRPVLEREIAGLGLTGRAFLLGQRRDVPDILAGLDAFVLSSRTEGYSLALVEASAAGLPIIATDVGGNREIVQDDVTGALVPAGDVPRMAQAMRALAAAPDRCAALGRAGRDWALREGAVETMFARYEALYARGPA